jgi:hypothetical protein
MAAFLRSRGLIMAQPALSGRLLVAPRGAKVIWRIAFLKGLASAGHKGEWSDVVEPWRHDVPRPVVSLIGYPDAFFLAAKACSSG